MLSNVICSMKYARHLPEKKRRETWEEIVQRNMDMHLAKFHHLGPDFQAQIRQNYQGVFDLRYLPSMRSLQFGGRAIELNNARIYNCGYAPIIDTETFGEIMYLLLCGCGMGFSVRKYHVSQLPPIAPRTGIAVKHSVQDSIAGWADAVKVLIGSYLVTGYTVEFDYSLIRPEGTPLVTSGGKAPGPEPLRIALENVRRILGECNEGDQLTPLQCHDVLCFLSDAVFAGGIRRSAMISLFSEDDEEMIKCKSGEWWKTNPQRRRANNTVVLFRNRVTKAQFLELWKKVELSKAGEPGFYFTKSKKAGVNPCNEAALDPYQFCNLVEINVSNVNTQEELNSLAKSSAFIGTLQASYTDFVYLRPRWRQSTEKDALLGVSMTGMASGKVLGLDLTQASQEVTKENIRVAQIIGINRASRTTLIKPSGTAALLLGTASGIHPWHSRRYIRRVEANKTEAVYPFFMSRAPSLVEDDIFSCTRAKIYFGKESPEGVVKDVDGPHIEIDTSSALYKFYAEKTPQLIEPILATATKAKIKFPMVAPEGSIYRDESALDFLERIKKVNTEWIKPGHHSGANTHNVSATISVKKDEWEPVGEWLWENRDYYNGVAILDYDDHTYFQAPFEECDEATITEMEAVLEGINLEELKEDEDTVDFIQEVSCSGGKCELVK